MKKLLAILVAGAFATSAFAMDDASAVMPMDKVTSSKEVKKHHKPAKKPASGVKKSHKKLPASAAM